MATDLTSLTSLLHSPLFVLESFFYALIGGVLPALVWLWFWNHESYDHPEPKSVIIMSFLGGMLAVFAVFPLQRISNFALRLEEGSVHTLFIWAILEESIKLVAAYIIALRFRKDVNDEPIDTFIYLMTVALGFAAMENTLYLITPLLQGDTIGSIMTGNLRFMGASLVHVVSSGVLSVFLSYSFYKGKLSKFLHAIAGIIAATILHTFFNYFIIISASEYTLIVFSFVWMTTILLILALERVKQIKQF